MGKKKCPEFENHERWLVSYADMLTLLFAVFVVLFALKEGGEPQVQKTAGSMQESFNTPLEDIPMDRRLGPTAQGFGIFEHFRGADVRPPLRPKYPATKKKAKIIDDEMARVKFELKERLYGPDRFRRSKEAGKARLVKVERTRNGFKIRVLAKHFYGKGSTKVRKSALKDLDTVLASVKSLGRNVRVEGHTDSLPSSGSLNNWDISALRATHIVAYMVKKHRFPHTRVSAAGFGDVRPIAHNGTESGRQLNRRVEIHVDYLPDGSGDSL